MTVSELRTKLSMIEPTEGTYAGLTDQEVPLLEQLVADQEEWLAARAVFALSRIGTPRAVAALTNAAADRRPEVRVAVASAVAQRPVVLPDQAVDRLLQDSDAGVRKFATRAVKRENGNEVRALLKRIAATDPAPAVRENAAEAVRAMR
jgi:HEAT repeat protein